MMTNGVFKIFQFFLLCCTKAVICFGYEFAQKYFIL